MLDIPEGEDLEVVRPGRCYRPVLYVEGKERRIIAQVPVSRLYDPSDSPPRFNLFLSTEHGYDGKKTAADRFDEAEADGLTRVAQLDVNGDEVFRHLEPCTERGYANILDFWDEYAAPSPQPPAPAPSVASGRTCADLDPALATQVRDEEPRRQPA
jgi:hypothetical protein